MTLSILGRAVRVTYCSSFLIRSQLLVAGIALNAGHTMLGIALNTCPASYVALVETTKLVCGMRMTNKKKPGSKLGAQKIKVTNFSHLESKAAEKEKLADTNLSGPSKAMSPEEEKRQMLVSFRFYPPMKLRNGSIVFISKSQVNDMSSIGRGVLRATYDSFHIRTCR